MKTAVNFANFLLPAFCAACLMVLPMMLVGVSGFAPLDDHNFVVTVVQGKSFGVYISPELGRFFPLTAQEFALAAKIFAPAPRLFYFISAGKVLVTGALLFYCLLRTGAGSISVAILWCVVIFSVGFANVAFRLHAGESSILLLMLVVIAATLACESPGGNAKNSERVAVYVSIAASVLALFYKEIVFVLALTFGAAEVLRHCRQGAGRVPTRVYALLGIGAAYALVYGIWRAFFTSGSYASFHSHAVWIVIREYALTDPFLLFVVLPVLAWRGVAIARRPEEHTIFESYLFAAGCYILSYAALGLSNTYYLLPAYAFGACGIAGVLSRQQSLRVRGAVLSLTGLFCVNSLPVALSDAVATESIIGNHQHFVRALTDWLWANPLPNSGPRTLLLEGVNPGNDVEIVYSLKIFLNAAGAPDNLFKLTTTLPSDNAAISGFYGLKSDVGYTRTPNDLLIFNPYQQVRTLPPEDGGSYRSVYRSSEQWRLPRWDAWQWGQRCLLIPNSCASNVTADMRYTGYAAFLVVRSPAPLQLHALSVPAFRVGPLQLPARLPPDATRTLNVLVQNSGTETWPATGDLRDGPLVHLSYLWFNENGEVVLEGSRSPFPEPVQPNDVTKVSLVLKTPAVPGAYRLLITPVQESVRWFSREPAAGTLVEIR